MLYGRPINSLFDSRILLITDMASNPRAYPTEVLEHYAWVRSLMATGHNADLIMRCRFELPMPKWVWDALDGRSFAYMKVQELVPMVADDAGWSTRQLKDLTGIQRWENTYPHLVTLCRVSIMHEDRSNETYSWRSYRSRSEREALADPEGRPSAGRSGTG